MDDGYGPGDYEAFPIEHPDDPRNDSGFEEPDVGPDCDSCFYLHRTSNFCSAWDTGLKTFVLSSGDKGYFKAKECSAHMKKNGFCSDCGYKECVCD